MSVAFRRDGDEEHLEPKFELPIPPGPNLVTARGKAMIDEKCAEYEAAIAAGAMRRKSNPPAAICAIGARVRRRLRKCPRPMVPASPLARRFGSG
jgi:hypothetical protein